MYGPSLPPKITLIDFDEKYFEEKEITKLEEVLPYVKKRSVTWINVRGLADSDLITRMGELFGLHPLTIEDILNTGQRPKLEDVIDYLYAAVKVFSYREELNKILSEQVSVIISRSFVISFEETDDSLFEPIREKLRKYKGRIRKMGTDYLAYRLLDAVIDTYFVILEKIEEKLEYLEEMVVNKPSPAILKAVHSLKIELTLLFRSVWPLREVIGGLTRDEYSMITKATNTYFRDVYDHTVQIIETMETDRDIISGMLDIYVSGVSNKMNEIMKVLTVIATIFIPMTFLAGVYGMNFEYFPELKWRWGYPAFWLLMIAIAVFMLLYFRRRKWL